MIFLNAFLLSGAFCLVAQIILDNTKMTPGHITSIFTVLGALLSFLGIYPKLIEWGGAGATAQISNFGNMLYLGALEGYKEMGVLGLVSGLLSKSSAAIASAVIIAFVLSFIFKPKVKQSLQGICIQLRGQRVIFFSPFSIQRIQTRDILLII